MVALIRRGVARSAGTWADLGAGTGNFTRALAALLDSRSTIYAVDHSASALARLKDVPATSAIVPVQGDFTRSLDLPALDGILMANSLHFIRDQAAVLEALVRYLHPGGRLLVVEYDVHRPLGWIPYPVPLERFQVLAAGAGLSAAAPVGRRRSPSSGVEMYAAVALRPGRQGLIAVDT